MPGVNDCYTEDSAKGWRAKQCAAPAAAAAPEDTRRIWSGIMAQVWDICGKGPRFGNNISHAHNITRRRWNVTLVSSEGDRKWRTQ